MAGIDDILKSLPIDQIASKLGVDPATAQRAVQEGGATILTGLQRNAQTPQGSAAIQQALGKHAGASATDIDAVDTADGQRILGHIFGGDEKKVAQKLTDEKQTAGIDFAQLLPMLAPVVMGLLAKTQQGGGEKKADAPASGGGIGDVIGGLLGGGAGGSGGGLDVGGLLGGLFGGKK